MAIPRSRKGLSKELAEELIALNAAILASKCPYCNAAPGNHCVQRPSGFGSFGPATTTRTSHMGRVKAGHARLKAKETT